MNKNQFIMLSAVVVALFAFAMGWQDGVKTAVSDGDGAKALFPGIDAELPKVDRIVLTHEGKSVNLVSQKDTWVVAEKSDYPAKTQAIRELLDSLVTMKLIEKKTSKPDNYGLLAIDDAQAFKVEIKQGDKLAAEALFGKESSGLQGQYVRKASDPQVWLGNKTLKLEVEPKEWIVDEIVNLDPEQVTLVERSSADGNFVLQNADGKLTLEQVPEDKQLADDYLFSGVKSALADLKALDVMPAKEIVWDTAVKSTYQTADKSYLVTHTKHNEKDYITLTVKPREQSDDSSAGKTTEEIKTTETDLEQLNARWKGWAFEVASYKAEGFTRNLDDLLVAKVEEAEAVDSEQGE